MGCLPVLGTKSGRSLGVYTCDKLGYFLTTIQEMKLRFYRCLFDRKGIPKYFEDKFYNLKERREFR